MSEETPKVDFSGLVTGLAASAIAVLAQVEALLDTGRVPGEEDKQLAPDETRKRVTDGLAGARQLIDTLAVLQQKTQGNLEADEEELLHTALSELRIRHVTLSNRPAPQVEGGSG
jgi:hypothetical protein